MEILTLLKANIRYKKGTFISIVLLMIIISMSLTAIISVRDNCRSSIETALEDVDAGDLFLAIRGKRLTQEVLNSVKNHSMVERVHEYPAIVCEKAEAGENVNNTSWFLQKQRSGYKLYNDDLTGYEDKMPALKKGEIYIPQGIMTDLECDVGDTLKLSVLGDVYTLKIKGIFVEPVLGASTMGWKQPFISSEDFEQIYQNSKKKETKELCADARVLSIYKSKDCTLSDGKFRRQLNLDTGIIDKSSGSLTKHLTVHYTSLFSEIICSVLMVFIVFLFVIVMIVMGHSISTGIEMEYVNLGVLKAQGFTKGRIRLVWMLQYLFAEIAGALMGIVLSVPLIQFLGNVFQPITGILAGKDISIIKTLLIILAILLISGAFVLGVTRKMGKISPVRAVSGGCEEVYFDSRIKAPICHKGLLASLALRQFTASKRRYAGTIIIVSILVFFMMTISVLGNVLDSKSAIESMSGIYTEIDILFKEKVDDKLLEEMEKTVKKYSPFEKKYYFDTKYCSINGEEIYCQIYKNPDVIRTSKGRAPLYDNEIVITEILSEELDINMGDKVTVAQNDGKSEYTISGIFQSMYDTGRTFAMSLEGAKKIGTDTISIAGYSIDQSEKSGQIADALNAEFGEVLEAEEVNDGGMIEETYTIAINAMKAVVYTFSVIFGLVVVMMVCSKMFVQEKKDIGIYKALGFTSFNLRIQFAVRFLIVALIGSFFGAILSMFFSGRLLCSVLRLMGITNFVVEFTVSTFLGPIILICGCFFLFAFLVSGKMKRVEIRELVME